MSIVSLHMVSTRQEASVIRIYSYQNKNLQGTLYHPYYGKEIPFSNLTRLLFLLDELANADNAVPDFCLDSDKMSSTGHKESLLYGRDEKILATFHVTILYAQNATWQGRVIWTETQEAVAFRSALELIQLLDSALAEKGHAKLVPAKKWTDVKLRTCSG